MWQQLANPLFHLFPRFVQIFCSHWQTANHLHITGGVQYSGVVQRPAVIVNRQFALRQRRCGVVGATAQTGNVYVTGSKLAGDLLEIFTLQLPAPGGNGANTACGAGINNGGQRRFIAQCRGIDTE